MSAARLLAHAGLVGSILCAATIAAAPNAGAATTPDTTSATAVVNGLGGRLQIALAGDPRANLVLSPLSVGVALTMTSAGAAGDTAAQMRDALGIGGDEVHEAFGALLAGLAGRDGAFASANSLWAQSGLTIEAGFDALLRDVYGSGLLPTDFAGDPAGALQAVNRWVSEHTAGRIPQLLTEQQVTDLTRFILVNAVHLDATWVEPFDPSATRPQPFTLADGSVVETDFMGRSSLMRFAAADGTQAVVLPYEQGLEMVVVLPAQGGLATFEAALADAGGDIDAVLGAFSDVEVSLRLPKWDIETRAGLAPPLQALGMTLPFSSDANFSNITTDTPLFVSDVVHQANITVDEAGTEAAAATAVIGVAGAAPGPQPELEVMVVDRPFFFAVRDSATGTILFQGHVNDPTGA